MGDPIAAANLGLSVVNQSQQAVSRWFTRKDLAEDIKAQLGRIQRYNDDLIVLKPHMEHLLSHNVVSRLKHRRLLRNVWENNQHLNEWETKIWDASPTDRVRRMKQILDQCEQDLKQLFDFCDEYSTTEQHASLSDLDIYRRASTVPLNPPRLLLKYNDPSTCEGKLKAAVLKDEKRRVVGIVASGKGGVGKTCAIRGLVEDAEVKERFGGGTLYIQLGNDATINHIISGLASNVGSTGGKKLSDKVKNCKTLQEACNEAAHWFGEKACLFLIDDIWRRNGINSQVLTILASMVNSKSRLVYTSRDKHFLGRANQVITFEGTEPESEQSRQMLLRHGGFSEIGELDDKNRTAFEKILFECKGLPLAFGVAGGVVHRLRDRQEEGREQDAWSDVGEMVSDPGQSILLRENAEQYGGLNRMVDVSLRVLENQYGAEKYRTMFRALCVLQKQQRAPVAMLQKLWSLYSLEETERAAQVLDEVSVLQLRKYNGVLCVQLHDLVMDIVREQAEKSGETQSLYRTLLLNYAPSGQDWWNIENDGYLHDNLCRLIRCAGNGRDVLQLLSEPKWVVRRLLDGGINNFEQDLEEGKQCMTDSGDDSEHKEFLEMVGKAARLGCSYFQGNEREIYFQLHGRLLLHATRNGETRKLLERLEDCAPRPWVKASMGLLQQAGSGALESIPGSGRLLNVQYREDTVSFIWATGSSMAVVQYSIATGFSETVEYAVESIGELKGAAFLQDERFIVSAHQTRDERELKAVRWSVEAREREQVVELKDNREITVPKRRRWRDMCSGCLGRRDSERPRQDEEPQRGRLEFVGFCKQGTLLATADESDHSIQMWDTKSGETMGEPLRGHTGWVTCVDVSADGTRIVSGSWDKTVRVWNAESGAAVGEPLCGHIERVTCVDVSADGTRILSGSDDKTVRVWDAESGAAVGEPLYGHTALVGCVDMSADGTRIVSGSEDKTVRMWDAESGAAVGEPFRGHTDWVTCMVFSADGTRIVSGSDDMTVRVWDAERDAAVGEPLRGHTGWVRCVDVSADGTRIVSGSVDKTVRVWDAESGAAVGEPLRGHTHGVTCVVFSADGTRIVSGSDDKTVRMWDAQSGAAVGEPLRGHTSWVECVDVSADGTHIVSGSNDATVRVWDAESGAAVGEPLRGHTSVVTCVDVSADGMRIVSASEDNTARVWDVCSGKQIGASLLHDYEVEEVALSADGSRVMTCTGAKRMMWDALSGKRLLTSDDEGWQSTVPDLSFSLQPQLGPKTRHVTTRLSDGSEIVLATCEEDVRNLDGTDVYWGSNFESCVIIR